MTVLIFNLSLRLWFDLNPAEQKSAYQGWFRLV